MDDFVRNQHQQPKVSIVVITWNAIDYLKQTVPVLQKLKYPNVEFIYIVNNSTDGTIEYLQQFKNIRLIVKNKNKGTSAGRNLGAKLASGEYIFFLDDDMLPNNLDLVDQLVRFYEALNRPAFVMPVFINKEDLDTEETYFYGTSYYPFGIRKKQPRLKFEDIKKIAPPIKIVIAPSGAIFIKKSVWQNLGGFDTSQLFNLDDDDITTRACVYGYNNYLYNQDYVIHLGLSKRTHDVSRYIWNDRTYISGKCKALIKNFSISTLWYMCPLVLFRMFTEAFYHTFYYRHLGILWVNILSFMNLIKTLPKTLQKRRSIQQRRKVRDVDFLRITPVFKLVKNNKVS